MADVRVAGPADAAARADLRRALWPEDDANQPPAVRDDALTLLALAGAEAIGLAEAVLRRDYVNGCDTSPVAFLEGLYVAPDWRRRGVARRLVEQVAAWGLGQGCTEFASDAPIDNAASLALHAALGFAETERVVFFRRSLAQ